MKTLARFASLLLVVIMCFSLVSCDVEEDIYERVQKYLAKEYPGKEFKVTNYEKQNETSGRYEINARCIDDGVEFRIYMYSSIAVTDSYSVERANGMMEEVMSAQLGDEMMKKFKYIKWHNVYADRATDYRFREVEVKDSYAVSDIEKIYEIRISENIRQAEIGSLIYDFMYSVCNGSEQEAEVKEATFVFKIGRYTYRFKTSSKAVLSLGRDGMVYYVISRVEADDKPFKEVEFEYFSAEEMEEAEANKKNKK
jgi:disulfide oxidoreductase YuzD